MLSPFPYFLPSTLCFLRSQADYDAHAVGRTPPSQDHRSIRLLPAGAEEDEENVTGLLKVSHAAAGGN